MKVIDIDLYNKLMAICRERNLNIREKHEPEKLQSGGNISHISDAKFLRHDFFQHLMKL